MNRRSFLSSLSTSGRLLVSTSPLLFATQSFATQSALRPELRPELRSELLKVSDTNISIRHSTSTINPGLTRRQWKTIVAVQDHLFPCEAVANEGTFAKKMHSANKQASVPGANEVNAKAYLYAVLADPNRDNEDRLLVKNGLIELQDLCWKKFKKIFPDCDPRQREESLRLFEQTQNGTPWIMTILGYIFEALLVDPIYGGNPKGIGWKWLQHNPGLPRPTAETRYYLL